MTSTTPLTKEERDVIRMSARGCRSSFLVDDGSNLGYKWTPADDIARILASHDAADALLLQKDTLLQTAIEALEPFAKINNEGGHANHEAFRRAARAHAMLKGE